MTLEPAPVLPRVANNYRAGDLLIDVGTRTVTREGRELDITGLSFDLLLTLVRDAPNLVSARELMERVWPGVVVSPETVIQRIMLLRQALGDSAENPLYIAAVRGHGYRMAAAVATPAAGPLQPAEASAASSAISAPGDDASASLQGPAVAFGMRVRRRIGLGVLAALGLLLVSGAAGLWWFHEHRGTAPVVTRVVPAHVSRPDASSIPRSSVAVMPFANLTGDPARDYLGDGMAEELIDTLAQVPGLKVPARTSTFAYKGRSADIRQIARDLGVATVLEGSVRSAGERLRVGVRLVDAASGFQIWSQDYDRRSPDLFQLQDDLAAQTVQALRGYLNVQSAAACHTSAQDPGRAGIRSVPAGQGSPPVRSAILEASGCAPRSGTVPRSELRRCPRLSSELAHTRCDPRRWSRGTAEGCGAQCQPGT
jgi:transcriptional activator of cad operon